MECSLRTLSTIEKDTLKRLHNEDRRRKRGESKKIGKVRVAVKQEEDLEEDVPTPRARKKT